MFDLLLLMILNSILVKIVSPPTKYSQLPSGGNMPSNYRALAWRAARPPYTWINSFCWAWT